MMQSFSKFAADISGDYTMTLAQVISMGYDTDEKLGLDDYPIFDESHRAELNEKIIRHYLTYDIGAETVQLFVHYLHMTMLENMPYFNERYKSAALEYDPLSSMDMTTDSETGTESQSSGKASSVQDSTSSSDSSSRNESHTTSKSYDSDVPATGVIGDFSRYASHANESEADSTGSSTGTQSSTAHSDTTSATEYQSDVSRGTGKSHSSGRSQSGASLVRDYRAAIINVDMEVVQSLAPCFMLLWGSYDTMLGNGGYGYEVI